MRIFDTKVQQLKYMTLKEVIKCIDSGHTDDMYLTIPKKLVPGPKATMRCCIYKERAVLSERVKMAMGGDESNPNVIEVIDVACDECPIDGIMVTAACRGCIVHKCRDNCPKRAISIVEKRAVIDTHLCVECGKCVKVCPYGAIIQLQRPCVQSCKAKALSVGEDRKAVIDNGKCIECGACVYQCPFGAIVDKSFVKEAVGILNEAKKTGGRVYAVIAPSIVSQFRYAKIEQVVSGILKLGFHQVVEAALGADIDLTLETEELAEKGILLTSCCPSFVMYVEKNFPELSKYISANLSPMVQTARLIKASDRDAKVIFIGPCSAKKKEFRLSKTGGAVDCVISFEELQAFLDAREIDVASLPPTSLDNASYYGRIFAHSGGVAKGIGKLAEEKGVRFIPCVSDGIEEVRANLLRLKMGKAVENFFEGMACKGGCINGALCINHSDKSIADVENYGREAKEKDVHNSRRLYNLNHVR